MLAGCQREDPHEELGRVRAYWSAQKPGLRETAALEKEAVERTRKWLAGSLETEPRSQAESAAGRIAGAWVPVHVGYRWLAQELVKQRYSSAEARAEQARLVAYLKECQFRALEMEHLAYEANRKGFRETPLGRVPEQIVTMRRLMAGRE